MRTRRSLPARCGTRRTSGSGCAASRGSSSSAPTGRQRRLHMRFSKWHALGNAYLLVERADHGGPLTSEDAVRLCDASRGVGADGVLEISEVRGAEADVAVWNPDGSRAELSGNGARIVAAWLARRSGVAFPRIRMQGRTIPARVEG